MRSWGHETSSVGRCGLVVVWIHPRCLVIVASPFIPTLRTLRHSPAHSTLQFPNNKQILTPLLQHLPEPTLSLLFTHTSSLPSLAEFDNFHNFYLQSRSLEINRSFPTQQSAQGDRAKLHTSSGNHSSNPPLSSIIIKEANPVSLHRALGGTAK